MGYATRAPMPIQLISFGIALLLFSFLESLWPRRTRVEKRLPRWGVNLGLSLLNTMAIRVAIPLSAYALASTLFTSGNGLFSSLSYPLAFCLTLVLFDFVLYVQHVLTHRIPFLWKLHQVHHSDLDLDATSGVRFHPVEIMLSYGLKLGVVWLLGCPPQALLWFEMLLNGAAIFTHSNLKLPHTFDRYLRYVIVTPDMHRIHHSQRPSEHHQNFGFNIALWDRLFGTYLSAPTVSHQTLPLGLPFQKKPVSFWISIKLPFSR